MNGVLALLDDETRCTWTLVLPPLVVQRVDCPDEDDQPSMHNTDRRHTDAIDPIVPDLSAGPRTDGGTNPRPAPHAPRRERPPQTNYASPYTRDEEELVPLVPDLR